MTTETHEYASKGVAGTGLGLGIAGTALGLLNGGLGMVNQRNGFGPYGNGYNGFDGWYGRSSFANPETQAVLRERDRIEDRYVSEKELDMNSKIMARDGEIAVLKSEKYTDQKLVEVYANLENQINGVKDKVDANRDRADDRLAIAFEKANAKMDIIRDRADDKLAIIADKLNAKIDCNKAFQDGVNAQQLAYNASNSSTVACMERQIGQLYGITKMVVPNTSVCPGWGPVTITPTVLSA